ncbi:centriole, cilia and spindle-associated protein-like isoform X1 [Heterodontus francisci]|uniref:centriole, cilia and spindle-associated protein-like isoform X1 n=1 Tax=Heterodontus francisci TaxID=7792 RepID=UPI00355C5AB6
MMSKRMKTEYMKKFKGPKWEIHSGCYSDLVQYRNMRRLLEQAHIPWVWSGWDSDSDSGSSTPRERCPEAPEPVEAAPPQTQTPVAAADRPEAQIPNAAGKEIIETNQKDEDDQQTKVVLCARPVLDYCRGKSASLEKSQKTSQLTIPHTATKETKPPFAMFGWAEREAEVGCKKTFNVAASALRGQIYESAVRAHDRREVQRTMAQRRHWGKVPPTTHSSERQCKSSPGHKPPSEHLQVRVMKPVGAEDPWLSEYMRCYSTRSL